MFESGLFGQGNAFWRWIATDEARPYLTAFAVDRAPPSGSEFFAADLSAEDLLDSEHLAELAQKIEAAQDRKSGVEGKRGSERVDLGGRRPIKKKNNTPQ